MHILLRNSLLVITAAVIYSCATPTSPTGGPPDREGPVVTETQPETGTINFEGRDITFHFSEFVNRGSVSNAITVEPDVGIPYSLNWGRKSLTVTFEDELPDSTTLIVTLGTDLKDMNGNKLATPQTVAVSTGSEIDKGKITGRILDAQTGDGEEGRRVLLYREPIDLTARANYSAETDTGGVFHFSYLAAGNYKAFWIDDRNRNRVWERKQERAQPFRREFVSLEKEDSDTLKTLYIAQSDTSAPELQGVGLFSGQRLRLRFSENIELLDSTSITVNDSLGNIHSEAYPLYVSTADPYVMFAQSADALAPEQTYEVVIRDIADMYGNIQEMARQEAVGSAQSDTTEQRIIKRANPNGLFPEEPLEVIYAKPITEEVLIDSLKIVAGTKMAENPQKYARTERNSLFILPGNGWKAGPEYEVRLWDPQRGQSRNVTPTIWHPSDFGELDIHLADTTVGNTYQLSLATEERGVMRDTSFSRQVVVSNLPPLTYRVIIYEDLNENNRWDQGQVEPYQAPEPYYIRNDVPVRSNFTSDLEVSLNR